MIFLFALFKCIKMPRQILMINFLDKCNNYNINWDHNKISNVFKTIGLLSFI